MGQDKQHYSLTSEELFHLLQTSDQGLSTEEATRRLKDVGFNEITAKEKISPLTLFLSQFHNNLILILLAAAGLIFFVWYFGEREQSDLVEAALILGIVVLITVLGFLQEWKAERAIDALKKLLAFNAKVVRNGHQKSIAVKELVPGDVVILEEGTKIPADIRLIGVANLTINEASLTGESVPATKSAEPLRTTKHLQHGDQINMSFSGTEVTNGRGTGVVVQTGNHTEMGKIAKSVAEVEEEPTPIQRRLDKIGKTIGWVVIGVAVVVFLFIVFFAAEFMGEPLLTRVIHSFIAAVSLAVAAIPEGLPAVVTISLALGTQRMLKRNVLVRRLNAVETLGSTDVICADKTGTLTKGEMTAKEIVLDSNVYEVTGTGYERTGKFHLNGRDAAPKELELILTIGLHANDADLEPDGSVLGDPTEVALLVAASKAGLTSQEKRISEIPFNSERKMMSVVVEQGKQFVVMSKGAPEILLKHCSKIQIGSKVLPLTAAKRKVLLDKTEEMSARALRTLGFAYSKTSPHEKDVEKDLIFVGLMGLIDPPRTEIAPLVTQCHASGIRVIMITGDHAATAEAVAKEIGVPGEAKTGEELDAMDAGEFEKTVGAINVYARVNPGFKMRIVEALKRNGHIVAMTGDGVNDAPALKKADIGIAMGITGTDVAKEASDMVLLDDHFASIVAAIEEGRGIYDNIRKFVNYLLSCNIGEVIVVFLGVLLFRDILLTATMLLWINVVTDGLPAIALGLDPPEQSILRASPKRFQGEIITRRLWKEMILFGVLISAGILGIFGLNVHEGQEEARATAFIAIVLLELIRLFHIRSEHKTPFFSNPWLLVAVGSSLLLQLAIVYLPVMSRVFRVAHVDALDWVYFIATGMLTWIVFQLLLPLLGSREKETVAAKPVT